MVNLPPHSPHSPPLLGHALPPEGPCVVQKGCDTQELLDALHGSSWIGTQLLPIHNQQLGIGIGYLLQVVFLRSLWAEGKRRGRGTPMRGLEGLYLSRGVVSQPALQMGGIVARDKTAVLQGAKCQRGLGGG